MNNDWLCVLVGVILGVLIALGYYSVIGWL